MYSADFARSYLHFTIYRFLSTVYYLQSAVLFQTSNLNLSIQYTVKPGQAYPRPLPTQDTITDFFIRKLNPLVVAATTIKFKSAFLHA